MNAEEVFLIKAAAKVFLALCPHGLLRRGRGGEAVDVGAGQQQLLVPQLGPVARASNQGYPKVHEDFTMNGLKHLLLLSPQRHYAKWLTVDPKVGRCEIVTLAQLSKWRDGYKTLC